MEPLHTVEFALQFAAALSAWWLLLAIPLLTALCVFVYRRQARAASRGHAWGLTALRVFILVTALVLGFRPSLIRRDILTYPGRLLFVLDDSASMGVGDATLSDGDALTIAREAVDSYAGREAPVADLRKKVLAVERALVRFEQLGRTTDRTKDSFWQEADRVQTLVNEQLATIAERAADLANNAGDSAKLQDAAGRCRELKGSLGPLFSGEQAPSAEFVFKMRMAVSGLAELLNDAQNAADRAAGAAGDRAPAEAMGAVRRTPRLDLAYSWLRRNRDALVANVKDLSLWVQPLSQKEPVPLKELGPKAPALSDAETDLTGVLLERLEEDNPFPLAGIVLMSDGRNLGETTLDAVTRAAELRSIPIFSAVVGGADEPPDLAVCEVVQPPLVAAGSAMALRSRLKTVLPKPEKVGLELMDSGTNAIPYETVAVDTLPSMQRRLAYTPKEEGLRRLTVRMGTAAAEVMPRENNSLDLVVRVVRPERVRVLYVDWKPRWESRFVLDVFRRLDYLDVNGLIVLAQPGGVLKRGVGKGFWPEDAGMLGLYDLVVLGDVPASVLTEAEWRQLVAYVEAGGTMVLLGTGQSDPLPNYVTEALLPTRPRTAETPVPADTVGLALTGAGFNHPVTRSLRRVEGIQVVEGAGAERRRADAMTLLQTVEGRALIAARFIGKGKTLLIDTDRLWRRLNSVSLDAHTAMMSAVPEWALEARKPVDAKPQPDLFRYTSRESVQVWTPSDGTTNGVVELRSGERVLAAQVRPAHEGATLASAVFGAVPSGEWTVTLRGGGSASEPLHVVGRSRELHELSRDETWLRTLSSGAGGGTASLVDAGRLLNTLQARNHVVPKEQIWRLWDSRSILWLLIVLLTVEWIWRKLAGLV